MGEVGFEPLQFSSGNTQIRKTGGSNYGNIRPSLGVTPAAMATTDSELEAIIAAWSTLPEGIRAGILAMVNASKQR